MTKKYTIISESLMHRKFIIFYTQKTIENERDGLLNLSSSDFMI